MPKFTCNVDISFSGNELEAENEKEYKEKVKESFKEEYGLDIEDEEISNIEVVKTK